MRQRDCPFVACHCTKAPRAGGCSRGKEEGLICGGPRCSAWSFIVAHPKALQLDELAGLGGLLDGVEKCERLDVIGGGHDGLNLAADDLHKVLELHLVR